MWMMVISVVFFIAQILLTLIRWLGLVPMALYVLLMNTWLRDWQHANYTLSLVIGGALFVLCIVWRIAGIIRKIRMEAQRA